MTKCSFCNKDIKLGTGTMFVRKDATILNFCAHKCEKNMLQLKRKPTSQKWVTKKQ